MIFHESPGFAPAKINLSLKVVGRRDDGYHQLDSIVVFANVGDLVTLAVNSNNCQDLVRGEFSFTARGEFAQDMGDNHVENLVHQAFSLYQNKKCHGRKESALNREIIFRFQLEKNLPVAAGLGGGSSDAAATLRLLENWWRKAGGEPSSERELSSMAAQLGSDVPVCLAQEPQRKQGRGEHVSPFYLNFGGDAGHANCLPIDVILFNPGIKLATHKIYDKYAKRNPGLPLTSHEPDGNLHVPFEINSLEEFCRLAVWDNNHLAAAACEFSPELNAIRQVLGKKEIFPHFRSCFMTGSGSTLVLICDPGHDVNELVNYLRGNLSVFGEHLKHKVWVKPCRIYQSIEKTVLSKNGLSVDQSIISYS